MSHPEFTPGPWRIDAGEIIADHPEDGSVVLGILYGFDHPGGPLPEIEADGRLIAAAPAMYEVCHGLAAMAAVPNEVTIAELARLVRLSVAVIAKVKGE